jgi:hypothetical protein
MLRLGPIACLVALVSVPSRADDPPRLAMSKPVVCAKIVGFADVQPLPDATLTADDKLTVYYEPSGYTIEKTKDGFHALFAQDGRLRKKGGKDALWQKSPMFEYDAKNKVPPYQIYMRTDLSLKGLPPGDYELDLTLHDRLAKGTKVLRTVGFKVVPAKEASADGEKGAKGKSQGEKQRAESKERASG